MGKTASYKSKIPDSSGLIPYSDEENAVWRELRQRQERLLPGRVCEEYLEGLEKLALPRRQVPQLRDVSVRLTKFSDFSLRSVPALISPRQFFALLAERKFPIATFIRRREDFDYLQEPDIFHEIFGHCPLLTHRPFADFVQKFGKAAQGAEKRYLWPLQRLFWFTVEFGLIETPSGTRIYGAGIASSPGETRYALKSKIPEHRAFDLLSVFRTPYRIDIFQPIYYVIQDYNQLLDLFAGNIHSIMENAEQLGQFPPRFPPKGESFGA